MIKLSPGWAGFLKGAFLAIASALAAYLADPANLTILSGTLAVVVAGISSAIESALKAKSGGTTALFGLAKIA